MKEIVVYVHGKGGSAQEAEHYKALFPDCEVIGFDYRAQAPYKVRAALLPVPLNTPMPTGAVTRSLWYVAVRSGDVHRVQQYLRTERDT